MPSIQYRVIPGSSLRCFLANLKNPSYLATIMNQQTIFGIAVRLVGLWLAAWGIGGFLSTCILFIIRHASDKPSLQSQMNLDPMAIQTLIADICQCAVGIFLLKYAALVVEFTYRGTDDV